MKAYGVLLCPFSIGLQIDVSIRVEYSLCVLLCAAKMMPSISFSNEKSERIQRGIFHENQHFHSTRKEVNNMAVFRIEKTRDYTVMSNHHLRNTELSLKAKGLLSLMLSLPDGWDYTTKGLARICKDGVDSICAGVQELEKHGYVIRERIRLPNGQLGAIEYTILEQPRPPEPKPEKPERENPVLGSPVLGKPEQGNPDQLNIDISNTYPSSKDPPSITTIPPWFSTICPGTVKGGIAKCRRK